MHSEVAAYMRNNARGPWGEFPGWSRIEWVKEVVGNHANLGYWEWVSYQMESQQRAFGCSSGGAGSVDAAKPSREDVG